MSLRSLALSLTVAAAAIMPSHAASLLDETPRIAVVSAFPPEWVELQKSLSDTAEHTINGRKFITGKLEGKDVVLFLSGVSMVNAAMTTQSALDQFVISSVVFSGIAGGADADLNIGDVFIADKWGQHLETILARKTDAGFEIPPFFTQQFPGYGMMVPNTVTVTKKGVEGDERRFWFDADSALLEAARAVAAKLDLEDCAEENKCLSEAPKVVVGGNGVSGSAFVDNAEYRDYLVETFEAKVIDMESAAVAQVAYTNDVPFLAVRSLSDLAGGGDGANEMATFMALASKNSATVVKALLAEMK